MSYKSFSPESSIIINNKAVKCRYNHTLVIGSGSAALASAVRLKRQGIDDLLVLTDDLLGGTSRNTGSDKQTYYKLSDSTQEPDSPYKMAEAISGGGAMHGDIALVESICSINAFYHLVGIGVPFPHNDYGGYTGYKTDHDPRERGISLGPYTSKEMVEHLEKECGLLGIQIIDKHECIKLIKYDDRIAGAVILDRSRLSEGKNAISVFLCSNMIFAPGGAAGLYETSVYPGRHTGAIGLAFEIGADAVNLTESQFGIASTDFRWNLSGSYQQVIPCYFSRDPETGECFSFLNEHFPSMEAMAAAIFLKGYQWPFDPDKIENYGSSLIDILVYRESVIKKRDVYLDFRINPAGDERIGGFSEEVLNGEVKDYWRKSGLSGDTPISRLEQLNPRAIELYKDHNIDLYSAPLKIAVCAQHNNGGLAGDIWWESTNIGHFFPVGEVNGTHGVSRPGGSALNSGQVGALRAAQKIANSYKGHSLDVESALAAAEKELQSVFILMEKTVFDDTDAADLIEYRKEYQSRMTEHGGLIRSEQTISRACDKAALQQSLIGTLRVRPDRLSSFFKSRHMVIAHRVYLEAVKDYLQMGGGSRGSSLVADDHGERICPTLEDSWRIKPDNRSLRGMIQMLKLNPATDKIEINWIACRPVPDSVEWFETVWSRYNNGEIFEHKEVYR